MPSTEIEQFAELLVQKIRDVAVASCDSAMRPNAKYPLAKRWKAAIDGGDQADLLREVIPDAVDRAVCQLLRAIDEGGLKLSFTATNGKTIDLTEEGLGELVGWYMGTWRAQYSKARFVDDFADLA
jgi:hypothetical protein